MTQKRSIIRAFAPCFNRTLYFAIFMLVVLHPFSARAFDILLVTGDNDTFSYFVGRTISRVVNRHMPGLQCKTVLASDDISNLTNL